VESLHAKLKRYEELLRGYGEKIDGEATNVGADMEVELRDDAVHPTGKRFNQPNNSMGESTPSGTEPGKMVVEHEMPRFLDQYVASTNFVFFLD
jgi:hypothetical protein